MAGIDNTTDELTDVSVSCNSYTHARRYPMVIGKIGGFVLPTPLSPSQIATLIGSFLLLLVTRRWWSMFTPAVFDVIVVVAVPAALAWAVRHLRMEGRSPIKMAVGVVTLLVSPPHGTVRGHQVWGPERPHRILNTIYIVGDVTGPGRCDTSRGTAGVSEPVVAELGWCSPWPVLHEIPA